MGIYGSLNINWDLLVVWRVTIKIWLKYKLRFAVDHIDHIDHIDDY
jgi:hypothetical protein